ncbi:hypothetical protein [Salinicola sp. CPA57]|uniref:hypothetical protein n=1 Tax=Salinicola sp. CPA57 TaxID=1949080 RepID=UPI000DA1EF56|nr:hypothetical protein [Salinicola sp. CPA57]
MSLTTTETLVTLAGVFFGLWTFVIAILGILAAPIIIDRVDRILGGMYPEDEILFKGYPLSFTRLGTYGRVILFRNTRRYQRKIFEGRPDLVNAVETMPRGLRLWLVWVHAPLTFTGFLFFIFGWLLMYLG